MRRCFPAAAWVVVAVAVASAFLALLPAVSEGFAFGDAPLYARQILSGDFSKRSVHVGYYVLGWLFTKIVPADPTYALNLMSVLFAAVSAGVAASVAYTITGRLFAGVGAAATLVAPMVFLEQAVEAEVYVVQVCFFLLCVQMVLWDRPVLAGISFAAAFLVTPSTLLTVPFLVLLRPQRRFVMRFGLSALVIVMAVLAPLYRDFFWGSRGLLGATAASLGLGPGLTKEASELWGFGFLLAFILFGLGALAKSSACRPLLLAIGVLWLCPFLFGEKFTDVPVQLPLYAMLAVVAGIGLSRALSVTRPLRGARQIVVALFTISVAFSWLSAYPRLLMRADYCQGYRQSIESMAAEMRPGDVAVAPFVVAVLADYYLWREDAGVSVVQSQSVAQDGRARGIDARLQTAVAQASLSSVAVWIPTPVDPKLDGYFESQGYRVEPFGSIYVARPATAVDVAR